MNIYQPMLFVGLGGTGCLIGTELERRLREELCGPDGSEFVEKMRGNVAYLPYQLPASLQFVYADLNESELDRIHRSTVPSDEHVKAAARNAHLARHLVPKFETYPQVARNLRLTVEEHALTWLPPTEREPRVSPIIKGAGQLPTVGRAALFETIRPGAGVAQRPINEAIDALSKSGAELQELGGRFRGTCDVFVAFSVAGGTGAGVFYDYLHIIGRAFQQADIKIQIYPLVLMPSAFEEGKGGGRPAKLNAGRAMLDLFRLIDDQNAQRAATQFDELSSGAGGQLGVRYPVEGNVRLDAGTVQTAFLFSRTPGMEREDIHRSICSLVLSLIAVPNQPDAGQAQVSDRIFQSFADDFINRAVDRHIPASSGIGNRSVSSSLVASLTVPNDDLAEIVSARLLARATEQLAGPATGGVERNRELVEKFFRAANLDPLLSRSPLPFRDVEPARGAAPIIRALKDRAENMQSSLRSLEAQLRQEVPEIARRFQHQAAVKELLREVDLFRLRRVVIGHPHLEDPVDRLGVVGMLNSRKGEPPRPPGMPVHTPLVHPIKDRGVGAIKAKWADPMVQATLAEQDAWYAWHGRRAWHEAWARQYDQWERVVERLTGELAAIHKAFVDYARTEPDRFAQRVADLSRERTGVCFLLPMQGDLDSFYKAVVRRFIRRVRLPENATEADVLHRLVDVDVWRAAYEAGLGRDPGRAVSVVRERLKQEVKRLFLKEDRLGDLPLLPGLDRLLARAASSAADDVDDADLRQFEQQLAALLPGGFSPQGTGHLKILISYPETGRNAEAEAFLQSRLTLPRDQNVTFDLRPVHPDSPLVVVLFRTSMAVNEVRELRELLRFWSDALRDEQPQDFLRWRQRLGYEYGWLATTEEHRVLILHHLMCAMWNGMIEVVDGPPESPRRVRVRAGRSRDSVAMTLRLTSFEQTSSWGSLLRAYEEWTLTDDEDVRRQFSAQLMSVRPHGLDSTPSRPHPLYAAFVKLARGEAGQVEKVRERLPRSSREWANQLHAFWRDTFPAAEERPFERNTHAVRSNLADLFEMAEDLPGGDLMKAGDDA